MAGIVVDNRMRHPDRLTCSIGRLIANACMPGLRQRLTILIYHRVLSERDQLRGAEPVVTTFRWQMQVVSQVFNVLSMSEAIERLRNRSLPPRAAVVTFDDGYADNASLALPVLREVGVPATVFVVAGFLNGGRMFNDTVIEAVRRLPEGRFQLDALEIDGLHGWRLLRESADRGALIAELLPHFKYADAVTREALCARLEALVPDPLPDDLMMTDSQVRELAEAGIEIGAHTMSHPILGNLNDEEAAYEIMESKRSLEEISGAGVDLFAYPNGKLDDDYTERDVQLVRDAGFQAAVSTHPGTAGPASDRYQLPRFTPWDRTPFRFLTRMGMNEIGLIK